MHRDLFNIIQAYGLLVPVTGLSWPSSIYSSDLQTELVNLLLTSEHFRAYPPSARYRHSFWKWIIANLEQEGEEIDDTIYNYYISTLSESATRSAIQPPPPSYITYMYNVEMPLTTESDTSQEIPFNDYHKCTLLESRTTIESGATGLRTWSASFILADYLVSHREDVDALRVLELGSGAGFLGIIVGQLQLDAMQNSKGPNSGERSASLWLTDSDEQTLSRYGLSRTTSPSDNLQSHPYLRTELLDWAAATDENRKDQLLTQLNAVNADLILGADLVYDSEIIPSLVAVLQLALDLPSQTARKAIIAATVRNEETLGEFQRQVEEVLSPHEEEVNPGIFACLNTDNTVNNGVKLFIITKR